MKPRGTVLPSFLTALLLAFLSASSASALTNLTPYLPSGWSDKIVVSRVPGTNTDSTSLTATDTLYLDWAVLNNGSTATAVRYHVEIYLDGALITSEYSDPPLNPNFYDYWEDASIGSLPAGTHTIRIKTDSTGVIAESNETDNEYTRTITVTGMGAPNLTPYQPSGWSDKIVVSRVPGTHTDSTSLTATDALYLDLAVTNIGSTATAVRFHTEIYIDGSLLTTGYSDPPLKPNFYSYWEDISIGSLPAGIHTIRIKTDWNGVIAETNEADNEYTKTVVITGAQACTQGQNQLCLNNNRFKVQVNWRVPAQGISGVGTAIPLNGGDTGYFWFFNNANVELMVKVLDGKGVNGHFWVFYGALSDVEYTLTVTDTATGLIKSYFNPQGRVASVADTSAFASSTPPVSSSLLTSPLRVEPLIPEQAHGSALAVRDASAARASRSSSVSSPFDSLNPTANAAPCVPSTTALCLNENRFSVKVTWRVPSGASGVGTAVPLTGDTGYFWFFNSANVELVIKILDGRGINGQFWVFYGALSDVEYTITVTDTVTGSVKTYSNVQGNLTSRADTSAFTDTGEIVDATAVAADAAGKAALRLGDVTLPIQLIDELTGTPIPGLSVGFALDPASRSYGVLMVIDPLGRYPPQIVILRGGSQGQSTVRLGSSLSPTTFHDPIIFEVSKAATRTVETISTTELTVALRYLPFASEIKDLAVIGAKTFNRLGVPTGPLQGLDFVRTEVLTQEEALAAIRRDLLDDLKQELLFITGELLLTGGVLAPVTVAAVGIAAITLADSTNTALNCGLPTQRIRVTRVGPDPLGMKFYECQNLDTNVTLYRVPAQGFDERGLPLTTGSLELVSKTQIGLGIKTRLDSQGKATPEVPVGDYELRLKSPGFLPATRALKVPQGGTSLSIKLDRPSASITFNAPAELPPAFVGTAYDFSFCDPRPTTGLCGAFPLSRNPTGGNPPYHFQLDSGGGFPPFGLSLNLNGILSGTPSAPGRSSTFRVCAVDLSGSSSCRTTSLNIGNTFVGNFTGSVIDTVSFRECTFRDTLNATSITANVTGGSGTLSDPFKGTFEASGSYVISVISGAAVGCYGDTIPFSLSGPVSGSFGKIEVHVRTTVRDSPVKLDVTNGVISGNIFTGDLQFDPGYGPPPIQGALTLTRR